LGAERSAQRLHDWLNLIARDVSQKLQCQMPSLGACPANVSFGGLQRPLYFRYFFDYHRGQINGNEHANQDRILEK
jgi:hypothetical protein